MKALFRGVWAGLFCCLVLVVASTAYAENQYCTPDLYPDYPVECVDSSYWWCCADGTACAYDQYGGLCCAPAATPVCCVDYTGTYYWYCAQGQACGTSDDECIGSATTTTTSIAGGTTTTTTIAGTSTTTVPGGSSTTTTTGGGGTSSGFIVGVNTNGQDVATVQSSGTLPGTSPSVSSGMLYDREGRVVPQMYDRVFAPLDPDLIERAFDDAGQQSIAAAAISAYGVGDQRSFWVKDEKDTAWRQVAATVKKESTHGILFVEDSLSIPDATLDTYIQEFEVMYTVVGDNIGTFTDRDGNNQVSILLYAINDGGSVSGYTGGYFWMKDYFTDAETSAQGIRSNEMDIIYIRGDEPAGWEQVGGDFYASNLTTLAHEYQHLVHFGIKVWVPQDANGASDTWIDEMMAMATETMYFKKKLADDPTYTFDGMQGSGYLTQRIQYYDADMNGSIRNGHGLTYWNSNGDVLANYALSYLFGQYLSIQSSKGQGIFKEILDYMQANSVNDYRAVAGAAAQSISGVQTWEDLLKSWAIANMANSPTGLFGYQGALSVTPKGPTTAITTMNSGGVVYRLVTGEATAPRNAGRDVKFYDANGNQLAGGSSSCAASQVLGGDSFEANLLRRFRDDVLKGTPDGSYLAALYYHHSDELKGLMAADASLKAETASVLLRLLPALQNILEGNAPVVLPGLQADIDALCESISGLASPGLQDALEEVRNIAIQDIVL